MSPHRAPPAPGVHGHDKVGIVDRQHSSDDLEPLAPRRLFGSILDVVVLVIAAATIVGMVALWPDAGDVPRGQNPLGTCCMIPEFGALTGTYYTATLNDPLPEVVRKVNVDENQEIASKYGIRGIPTLMLFRNGAVVATKVGALSKSQLTAFLDSNL